MSTSEENNLADAQLINLTPTQANTQLENQSGAAGNTNEVLTQTLTLLEDSNATSLVPQQRQPKICGVCTKNESKYKCTRCTLPYCSVACSVLHKATHADDIEAESPATVELEQPPAPIANAQPGTIAAKGARNPFIVLETSQELQTLFVTFPQLRSQLYKIYSYTQAPIEDSFTSDSHIDKWQSNRGYGGGRGRGSRGRGQGPWTQERGTQDGIAALRRAQKEYGKGGEGIREFEQLVLKLVLAQDRSNDGVDAAAIVQQEVAEENARIISQLLNGEDY